MEKRVLLVEPDLQFTQRVAAVLHTHPSLRLFSACLAAGAMLMAKQGHFDLYILSAELSDMSGFLLCKKLREVLPNGDVPIILTSTMARKSDFEKHQKLKVAANQYLRKPISDTTIFNQVTTLLGFVATYEVPDRLLDDQEYGDVLDLHRQEEEMPEDGVVQAKAERPKEGEPRRNPNMSKVRARVAAQELPSLKDRLKVRELELKEAYTRIHALEGQVRAQAAQIESLMQELGKGET